MQRIIISAMLFILLISCTKKETTVKSCQPVLVDVEFTSTQILKKDITETKHLDVLRFLDDKILLSSNEKCQILVCDSMGNFLLSFGREGDGPGEMRSISSFCVDSHIIVNDIATKKMVFFDLEGKFIKNVILDKRVSVTKQIGKNYLGYQQQMIENGDDLEFISELKIFDSTFKPVSDNLFKYSKKKMNDILHMFYTDMSTYYAIDSSAKKVYISSNQTDRYLINVYDYNGKLMNSIKKKFVQISYTKDEFGDQNGFVRTYSRSAKFVEEKKKYKKAIYGLWFTDGYLLVAASKLRTDKNKNSLFLDVFKDEKFITTIEIKDFNWQDAQTADNLAFHQGKIYRTDAYRSILFGYRYQIKPIYKIN